ncbi:MYADM protein, partial [Polypterus senegalus]|nr:myeloid-associated differentiation marker homolog [Polypterus senegalus]MBN3294361.1 MYADM protein [Polypterus senegalus]
MPVILGEARILTSPQSIVRILEMLFGCVTFSLVVSADSSFLDKGPHWFLCMFSWCFFFVLTGLILLVEFVQFQSLVPLSWKNLPISMAFLGALMTLSASVCFPLFVIKESCFEKSSCGHLVSATIFSCFSFLSYSAEVYMTKVRSEAHSGYMSTTPGFLKVFEVFCSCMIFVSVDTEVLDNLRVYPLFWWSLVVYSCCFLMSVCTIVVMLGECTGRCLVPFDRILAAFSMLCVVMYVTATGFWLWHLVNTQQNISPQSLWRNSLTITIITCLNLLTYTVDLAFSIKLVCYRT